MIHGTHKTNIDTASSNAYIKFIHNAQCFHHNKKIHHRRVLNTMTSPGRGRGRGRGGEEEIFVVNMQRLGGDSGVGVVTWTQPGKVDSW